LSFSGFSLPPQRFFLCVEDLKHIFKKKQKCFERIVTQDIPDCLVIINANKNSIAIVEVGQL
jgi:ribosomal protein S2